MIQKKKERAMYSPEKKKEKIFIKPEVEEHYNILLYKNNTTKEILEKQKGRSLSYFELERKKDKQREEEYGTDEKYYEFDVRSMTNVNL